MDLSGFYWLVGIVVVGFAGVYSIAIKIVSDVGDVKKKIAEVVGFLNDTICPQVKFNTDRLDRVEKEMGIPPMNHEFKNIKISTRNK